MPITIEKIYRSTTKKDGSPLINKYKKPYTLVNIMAEGKKYTLFDNDGETESWVEGDTIPSGWEVEESVYNGEPQFTLKKPNKQFLLENRVASIEKRLDAFAKWATKIENSLSQKP